MKKHLIPITLLLVFLGFGCKQDSEMITPDQSQVINKQVDSKVAVLVENFALASVVKALVDNKVQVIAPVPQGNKPADWQPSSEQIQQFNDAEPLIFVTGTAAPWISSISKHVGVFNVFPKDHNGISIASDPRRTIAVLDAVEPKLQAYVPNQPVTAKAAILRDRLNEYQEKIEAFGKVEPDPPLPFYGEIEPSLSSDILELLDHRITLLAESPSTAKLSYVQSVLPILEAHCVDCHDEENDEGELNFDHYLTEKSAIKDPDLWEKVAVVVDLEQMPPAKRKTRLTEDDKKLLSDWATDLTERWASGEMGTDPGMTTVHRLNKNEYNYTIRDLFGLQLRPADNFPEESGSEAGFDNNADALFLPALLMENYIESGAAIVEAVYANREARARYLFAKPSAKQSASEAAKRVLGKWSQLIYRKRSDEKELERLLKLFERQYANNKDYDRAMTAPLYAMLISPNFLYRSTLSPVKKDPYAIDDFELANRLSYFIWSSMPDRELFGLAAAGKLKDPSVIETQVKRMLEDSKSSVLGMHFAGQWFQWELLRTSANPDRKKYPEFDFQLRVSLYQESSTFFNHLVKNNLSAYQLIDSDYTFLNEKLAKHYRIPGVTGNELRQVKLSDPNRGGVLGMGSVMTATALPLRSSPAIRGAFVLGELLGTPPPDPPMDVEQLPDDDRKITTQTFREALIQHREDANCRSCHQLIDPLGFGLEAFDAIGRFRTTQNGAPLDTNGEMPDGTQFSSPAELKKALLSEKDLFAKNMVERLLSYALGRELSPFDRPTIDRITKKVTAADARMQTAFIEVAKSYPMLNRRGDDYKPKTTNRK